MMARITNVLRQVANRGRSSIVKASGKGDYQHQGDKTNGFQTCSTELVTQLQALFEAKEQELNERERALDKRWKMLEKTYPKTCNPSDVLHLNVGGSTNVAVLRRTLTHFENSMLGYIFSGRWDDKLEKTKCGSFFIDQDPTVFSPLLNYLRYCDQKTPNQITIPPPHPTREFCFLLEYYGLMSYVYPQKWHRVWGKCDGVVITHHDDFVTISSGNKCGFVLDVIQPLIVTSFTLEVEAGSIGLIGWMDGHDPKSRSVLLDVENFQFMIDGCHKQRFGGILYGGQEHPVTIHCTRDLAANQCSFQVIDSYGDESGRSTFHCNKDLPPFISFQGKMALSDVSYSVGISTEEK